MLFTALLKQNKCKSSNKQARLTKIVWYDKYLFVSLV